MPFETPFGPGNIFFDGTIEATVHEHAGAPPTTIIRTGDPWSVHIRWRTDGLITGMVGGNWHLHVFLESIGPGPDLNLVDPADHIIPLTPGSGPGNIDYSVHFDVPGNRVPAPAAGRLYKMVVSLTYFELSGSPGPVAAFVEGPVLQFYNP